MESTEEGEEDPILFSAIQNRKLQLSQTPQSSVPKVSTKNTSKHSSQTLLYTLMNDATKRKILIQRLLQEKTTKFEDIIPNSPVKLKRKQRKFLCESPTALLRRRALQQQRQEHETTGAVTTHLMGPSSLPFEQLLQGVIAYVEVKSRDADRSGGAKALMRAMGANVKDSFTRDVTHVVFKDGSFITYQKAKLMKVHLVSVLWLEAMRRSRSRVPEKNYPALGAGVFKGNLSIFCQELQKDYEEVVRSELRDSIALNATNKRLSLRTVGGISSSLESKTCSHSPNVIGPSQDLDVESVISKGRTYLPITDMTKKVISTTAGYKLLSSSPELTSDSDSSAECVTKKVISTTAGSKLPSSSSELTSGSELDVEYVAKNVINTTTGCKSPSSSPELTSDSDVGCGNDQSVKNGNDLLDLGNANYKPLEKSMDKSSTNSSGEDISCESTSLLSHNPNIIANTGKRGRKSSSRKSLFNRAGETDNSHVEYVAKEVINTTTGCKSPSSSPELTSDSDVGCVNDQSVKKGNDLLDLGNANYKPLEKSMNKSSTNSSGENISCESTSLLSHNPNIIANTGKRGRESSSRKSLFNHAGETDNSHVEYVAKEVINTTTGCKSPSSSPELTSDSDVGCVNDQSVKKGNDLLDLGNANYKPLEKSIDKSSTNSSGEYISCESISLLSHNPNIIANTGRKGRKSSGRKSLFNLAGETDNSHSLTTKMAGRKTVNLKVGKNAINRHGHKRDIETDSENEMHITNCAGPNLESRKGDKQSDSEDVMDITDCAGVIFERTAFVTVRKSHRTPLRSDNDLFKYPKCTSTSNKSSSSRTPSILQNSLNTSTQSIGQRSSKSKISSCRYPSDPDCRKESITTEQSSPGKSKIAKDSAPICISSDSSSDCVILDKSSSADLVDETIEESSSSDINLAVKTNFDKTFPRRSRRLVKLLSSASIASAGNKDRSKKVSLSNFNSPEELCISINSVNRTSSSSKRISSRKSCSTKFDKLRRSKSTTTQELSVSSGNKENEDSNKISSVSEEMQLLRLSESSSETSAGLGKEQSSSNEEMRSLRILDSSSKPSANCGRKISSSCEAMCSLRISNSSSKTGQNSHKKISSSCDEMYSLRISDSSDKAKPDSPSNCEEMCSLRISILSGKTDQNPHKKISSSCDEMCSLRISDSSDKTKPDSPSDCQEMCSLRISDSSDKTKPNSQKKISSNCEEMCSLRISASSNEGNTKISSNEEMCSQILEPKSKNCEMNSVHEEEVSSGCRNSNSSESEYASSNPKFYASSRGSTSSEKESCSSFSDKELEELDDVSGSKKALEDASPAKKQKKSPPKKQRPSPSKTRRPQRKVAARTKIDQPEEEEIPRLGRKKVRNKLMEEQRRDLDTESKKGIKKKDGEKDFKKKKDPKVIDNNSSNFITNTEETRQNVKKPEIQKNNYDDLDSSINGAITEESKTTGDSDDSTPTKRRKMRRLYNLNESLNEASMPWNEKDRDEKINKKVVSSVFKKPAPFNLTPLILTPSVRVYVDNLRKKLFHCSDGESSNNENNETKRKAAKDAGKDESVKKKSAKAKQTLRKVRVKNKKPKSRSETRTKIRKSCSESSTDTQSDSTDAIGIELLRNRRSTLDFVPKVIRTPAKPKATQSNKQVKKTGIVCTRFHNPDVQVFHQIVKKLGSFVIEEQVTAKTTHLVVGEPMRTVNILRGIAMGCWILRAEWLYKSLEADEWLAEEDYELTEFSPAVQQCRQQRQAFGRLHSMDIFENCGPIHIAKSSVPKCLDLQELVKLCKGNVTAIQRNASIVVGESVRYSSVTCVSEKWVLDSVMYNKRRSFESYLISQSQKNSA